MRAVENALAALMLITACGTQAEPEPNKPAPVPTPPPALDAAPAKVVAPSPGADAGATEAIADGAHVLDLDGDGVDEKVTVSDEVVRVGGQELAHGLKPADMRPVVVAIIDIDGSDQRKELLLRVSEYESLGHHVVVYQRGDEPQVSKVLFTRDVRTLGDGYLRSTSWEGDKRRELVYAVTHKGVVPVKQAPKR